LITKEAKIMSAKTVDVIAEETRKMRIEMRTLIETQGLAENVALKKVLPNDLNRCKKLKQWKEKGLWPVPESELREHATPNVDAVTEATPSKPPQSKSGSISYVNSPTHSKSVDDSETETLKKVRSMIDKIKVTDRIGQTAPKRRNPNKGKMIAARIAPDVFDEFQDLEGRKSFHIERALRLYLAAMKAGESENEHS
jgi:hypothetical protein